MRQTPKQPPRHAPARTRSPATLTPHEPLESHRIVWHHRMHAGFALSYLRLLISCISSSFSLVRFRVRPSAHSRRVRDIIKSFLVANTHATTCSRVGKSVAGGSWTHRTCCPLRLLRCTRLHRPSHWEGWTVRPCKASRLRWRIDCRSRSRSSSVLGLPAPQWPWCPLSLIGRVREPPWGTSRSRPPCTRPRGR